MIKLIIFDLDGVLIDSKDIHFNALNDAIEDVIGKEYKISYEDHINRYDGNPTKVKLQMLHKEKALNTVFFSRIYNRKQEYTEKAFETKIKINHNLINIFKRLRGNFKLHVASNCIRKSTIAAVKNLGLDKLAHYVISNEDVKKPKPAAEMYLKCMLRAGVNPKETLIIEDSYVGRLGAYNAGAYLFPINKVKDLTEEGIMNAIKHKNKPQKWKDDKLNIVILAGGAGKRFALAGYTFPKSLIDINGKPMIQVVVENLNIDAHYIYIIQEQENKEYNMAAMLKMITPDCTIIEESGVTGKGAAFATLLAKNLINNDNQLLISNSDQWMDWDSSAFMYAMQRDVIDGGILTFRNTHPKWSYAKLKNNWVCEVAEKVPISNNATVGIYFWKKGSDYVKYAEQMMSKNIRTKGEFYVCPVYNEAIQDGKHIKIWDVKKMMGLGTPEDLERYLKWVK